MTVPGSNLLNMALGLIAGQRVGWRQYLGMVTNPAGVKVVTWAAAVDVFGSFQPVPATLLQQYGLDVSKNYATFYASRDMTDPDRNKTGDRLIYAGKVYQVESKTPWFAQDGWESVLCVEVTNATA